MRKLFSHRKRNLPATDHSTASVLPNHTVFGNQPPSNSETRAKPDVGRGVRTLYEPPKLADSVADIVFVHGLTGSSASTWYHERANTFWPTALLSKDIPTVRIISFGYDADVVNFWSPASGNRVGDHALNLLGRLNALREGTTTEERSIIFVAHSLGGLIVEDCLCLSRSNAEKHLQHISAKTVGIMFLGTPQHGADLAAWAKVGSNIAKVMRQTNSDILTVLQPQSEILARIQTGFYGLLRSRKDEGSEISITGFYEERPLPVVGKDMTKFSDKEDDGYISVLGELRRWVKTLQPVPEHYRVKKPLFIVPFGKDPLFVDRVELLERIKEQTERTRIVALSGIGGVGKSQIALEFCFRFQRSHPDASVFWVHGSTRERFEQDYTTIARRLNLPDWNKPDTDTLLLVYEWFNEASNGDWLMVVDSADDLRTFFDRKRSTSTVTSAQRMRPLVDYLPVGSHGSILITTRDKRLGERLASPEASLVVDPMSFEEARVLLTSQSRQIADLDTESSRTLLETLGFIPLAITQAAAFIKQNSVTLADYLDILGRSDNDLQYLLEEDVGDVRRDSESQNSVFRTWKISFDLIAEREPRAAELLSLMAVLDRQGIPKSLLELKIDRIIELTKALGTLQAFSLIKAEDHGTQFGMHRLVQLATRKWIEIQGKIEKWKEEALVILAKVFPSGHLDNWMICEPFAAHAQMVLQYVFTGEHNSLQYALLARRVGYFDFIQARFDAADSEISKSLNLCKSILGRSHPKTLKSKELLYEVYSWQGRWNEAEKLARQLLKTRKRSSGEDSRQTLCAIDRLAQTLMDQSRYDEAESLQMQITKSMERVLEPDDPEIRYFMFNLAEVYMGQERWKEAERLLIDLTRKHETFGEEASADALTTQAVLATCFMEEGRFAEAEKLGLQVLESRKKALPADHPAIFNTMYNLAFTYRGQWRYAEALDMMKHVADLRTKVLGPKHPHTEDAIGWLDIIDEQVQFDQAMFYKRQGRYADALDSMRDVVDLRIDLHGRRSRKTQDAIDQVRGLNLEVRFNDALTLARQGRFVEALALMKHVAGLRPKLKGTDFPRTLKAAKWYDERRHSAPACCSPPSILDMAFRVENVGSRRRSVDM